MFSRKTKAWITKEQQAENLSLMNAKVNSLLKCTVEPDSIETYTGTDEKRKKDRANIYKNIVTELCDSLRTGKIQIFLDPQKYIFVDLPTEVQVKIAEALIDAKKRDGDYGFLLRMSKYHESSPFIGYIKSKIAKLKDRGFSTFDVPYKVRKEAAEEIQSAAINHFHQLSHSNEKMARIIDEYIRLKPFLAQEAYENVGYTIYHATSFNARYNFTSDLLELLNPKYGESIPREVKEKAYQRLNELANKERK